MLLLLLMKPVVLLTVIGILTVPPTPMGKVAAVDDRVKVSVVLVTVKLTAVEIVVLPLIPVTVIVWGPAGKAMFGAVVMVRPTDTEDLPFSVTLAGLKLQRAPAGKPEQLPPLETVELVKFTVPVKPPAGVIVIADVVGGPVCPEVTVRLDGTAEIVNGVVTVTAAAVDVELLWDASPS